MKFRSKIVKKSWLAIMLCFIIMLTGCSTSIKTDNNTSKETSNTTQTEQSKVGSEPTKTKENSVGNKSTPTSNVNGELKIHYIDVGQADSILIQQGNAAMVIDAGNNNDAQTIINYINELGIQKLDYVVGTHGHEDHIGSMDIIIKSYEIGKVYFPKQPSTTETFKDFASAVAGKGLKFTVPKVGESFKLGEANCTILAPNGTGYKDANDYSIVIKVTYGTTSFLLTGDAEAVSEMEMVKKGLDLKSDVLKISHHGSKSSTVANFLSAVNPKYAIVSVGKDNSYNHPSQSTMDRLKKAGVKVFRTDEQGTIVAISNGTEITFNQQPGSYSGKISTDSSSSTNNSTTGSGTTGNSDNNQTPPKPTNNNDRIVYWTPGGKSYHYDKGCSTLSRSKVIEEGPLSNTPKSDPCDRCVR